MSHPEICHEIAKDPVQDTPHCFDCRIELDILTAQASEDPADSIYICFEYLRQKAFVYGKFTGGSFGAMLISRYFTKDECRDRVCEDMINEALGRENDAEYSRMITCERGQMNAVVLTRNTIQKRKEAMRKDINLSRLFKNVDEQKKYFCHTHAEGRRYVCACGEELIRLGSERHRELSGMKDQDFIEKFLPGVLQL